MPYMLRPNAFHKIIITISFPQNPLFSLFSKANLLPTILLYRKIKNMKTKKKKKGHETNKIVLHSKPFLYIDELQ